MISGMYLGEITRLCMKSCIKSGELFKNSTISPDSCINQFLGIDTADISYIMVKEDNVWFFQYLVC